MATYFVIRDNKVDTVAVAKTGADLSAAAPDALIVEVTEDNGHASIGWAYEDGFFSPPPVRVVVPEVISKRQFYQQLAAIGTIPRDEALAAVRIGTLPPALAAIVELIADDHLSFQAQMSIAGANSFKRHNVFVAMIGAMLDPPMGPAELDAFWVAASAL